MSEYQDYLIDPITALEKKFESYQAKWLGRNWIFCHRGFVSLDGVKYGSYQYVNYDELIGRRFDITCWDYSIGIDFLDVLHNPYNRKSIYIPYNMGDTSDEVVEWVRSERGKAILYERGFGEFTSNNWRMRSNA